jgi:hypothetical protein
MHKPHGSQEQQNKIIGLMAQFGSELLNNPNRDFSSTLRATELYENYTQVLFGKADKTHFKYAESWKTFAADEQNRRIAKVVAQEIAKARHQKNPEKPNIAVPIKTLLLGKSLSGSSYHHIFERKFAALFLQTDKFNYSDNLVYTMRLHPADKSDPHREAHKFDTKELYYWRTEDGSTHQGTALRIPEGAEVLRPALYKKDESGQSKPVIDYNTLMVTSSGESISWPHIPGYHGKTKYFSNQNKAQQAPNLVNNNGGNER